MLTQVQKWVAGEGITLRGLTTIFLGLRLVALALQCLREPAPRPTPEAAPLPHSQRGRGARRGVGRRACPQRPARPLWGPERDPKCRCWGRVRQAETVASGQRSVTRFLREHFLLWDHRGQTSGHSGRVLLLRSSPAYPTPTPGPTCPGEEQGWHRTCPDPAAPGPEVAGGGGGGPTSQCSPASR